MTRRKFGCAHFKAPGEGEADNVVAQRDAHAVDQVDRLKRRPVRLDRAITRTQHRAHGFECAQAAGGGATAGNVIRQPELAGIIDKAPTGEASGVQARVVQRRVIAHGRIEEVP